AEPRPRTFAPAQSSDRATATAAYFPGKFRSVRRAVATAAPAQLSGPASAAGHLWVERARRAVAGCRPTRRAVFRHATAPDRENHALRRARSAHLQSTRALRVELQSAPFSSHGICHDRLLHRLAAGHRAG